MNTLWWWIRFAGHTFCQNYSNLTLQHKRSQRHREHGCVPIKLYQKGCREAHAHSLLTPDSGCSIPDRYCDYLFLPITANKHNLLLLPIHHFIIPNFHNAAAKASGVMLLPTSEYYFPYCYWTTDPKGDRGSKTIGSVQYLNSLYDLSHEWLSNTSDTSNDRETTIFLSALSLSDSLEFFWKVFIVNLSSAWFNFLLWFMVRFLRIIILDHAVCHRNRRVILLSL